VSWERRNGKDRRIKETLYPTQLAQLINKAHISFSLSLSSLSLSLSYADPFLADPRANPVVKKLSNFLF